MLRNTLHELRDMTMESILAQSDESKAFVKDLCFEFADEAASLWRVRQRAVCAPHYTLSGLRELDNRLEAQIDALRVAGEPGWETAFAQTRRRRVDWLFAPSVLAFQSNDENRIKTLLEKAEAAPDTIEAVISALGWLSYEQAQPHIKHLLLSKSTVHQTIGIAASAFHRKDPGPFLENAFYSKDLFLKALSLKAVGELGGRGDKLMPGRLQDQMKSQDPPTRFWAAWSAALLGDAAALNILKPFALDPALPLGQDAMNLVLRKIELKDALALQAQLAQKPRFQRQAVIAAGIMGDPVLIPWLIRQMSLPPLARRAGEALTNITGINLETEKLQGSWPEGFSAGPTDDPKDPNVEMDPDENLPWPDAPAASAWWDKNKTKFKSGERLFLGKPVTKEHLQSILQTGFQGQRAAAALALAIMEPGKPLYNVCVPAHRQLPQAPEKPYAAVLPNYGSRPLAITAANCITPLGHNAEMTAASVRAGVCRHVIYEGYQDQNGKPVTVARIQGIKDHVQKTNERIRGIAEKGLADLLDKYFVNKHQRPPQAYFFLGTAVEERPGPDYGEESMIVLKHLMAKYMGNVSCQMINKGNASLHYAIGEASQVIEKRPDSLCVIGCVDSLLAESILDGFESDSRLKSFSHGRHHGLIASEAAGFLIVEDLEHARQNKRAVLARIRSLGLAEEKTPRVSGEIGLSQGLTSACHIALTPLKDQSVQNILGDLNGEDARAEEWTVSKGRCFTGKQALKLWKPAEYYGDVGASAGVTLSCIAAEGFKRNWLSSPALIFCSDDSGPCGAVILEKHEEKERSQEIAQALRPMTYLEKKLADLEEMNRHK